MITFKLTKPISSSNKEYTVLELQEPRVIHMPLVSQIKEGYNSAQLDTTRRFGEINQYNKAVMDQAKDEAEAKAEDGDKLSEEDLTEGVKVILNVACTDTARIFENMGALLASTGIAKICLSEDGENNHKQDMQKGHVNSLSIGDMVDITSKYMAVFIMPS